MVKEHLRLEELMENYFYKCPVCGFIHIVPAYWLDYVAEDEIKLEHLDIKSGKMCVNKNLKFLGDEKH